MGREIKRVPMDFNWPLDEPWEGFLNPYWEHRKDCPCCEGSGVSIGALELKRLWYGDRTFHPSMTGSVPFNENHPLIRCRAERIVRMSLPNLPDHHREREIVSAAVHLAISLNSAWRHHLDADDVEALVAGDRLWEFTRVPRTPEQQEIVRQKVAAGENSWLPENNGYMPTPAEVNEWSLMGFGHDSINQMIVCEARAKRLGIPFRCSECDGDGNLWNSPEDARLYEEWEKTEPPAGEGWQVWETVSEGSPITPVFETSARLVNYLVKHGDSSGRKWQRENAEAFVKSGWTPSGLIISDDSGVRTLGAEEAAGELPATPERSRNCD